MKQETELLQVYGKDHPEVIRIRERIKSAKNFHQRIEEISREGESSQPGSDPVQSALKALQLEHLIHTQNHEHWNDLLEELKAKARSLENHYEQDKAYRNNIARVEHVLDTTTKRLEEINLIRGYGGFEAKTLSPPAPGGKVSPVLWQFLFMGAALGFGLSAVGAYLLDMADKSFRNPEEVRRRLGLPIVGHVPYVPTSVEPVKTVDGAGNPIELDPGLVSFHQPMSPHAEGFRGIRTALYFNTHGQRHTVIQVTSPNMGDGKTTLITNLAISIAQSGRKVLLVDADLRRPRIHRAFGLSSKIGLAEVIAGTAELDEAIQVTVVPNLSALPCGRRPQNPAELLTSPRFEDVIDDLRSAFDYVLIDTPPLLAVSDPCIVAPRVDGLLLTIRLAKNGRPAAERSKDLLAGLKVNCIGLVVNGVGKHGSMSGYGYEHYRYTDDYTTAYTTNDGEHAEMALESGDTGPTGKSMGRSESKAGERVPPTLGTVAEPSSNGHAAHPLVGE
jgi:capsular exopolysaccharide synthesis family protein